MTPALLSICHAVRHAALRKERGHNLLKHQGGQAFALHRHRTLKWERDEQECISRHKAQDAGVPGGHAEDDNAAARETGRSDAFILGFGDDV